MQYPGFPFFEIKKINQNTAKMLNFVHDNDTIAVHGHAFQ